MTALPRAASCRRGRCRDGGGARTAGVCARAAWGPVKHDWLASPALRIGSAIAPVRIGRDRVFDVVLAEQTMNAFGFARASTSGARRARCDGVSSGTTRATSGAKPSRARRCRRPHRRSRNTNSPRSRGSGERHACRTFSSRCICSAEPSTRYATIAARRRACRLQFDGSRDVAAESGQREERVRKARMSVSREVGTEDVCGLRIPTENRGHRELSVISVSLLRNASARRHTSMRRADSAAGRCAGETHESRHGWSSTCIRGFVAA